MPKLIRRSVFETNSSSCHSISIEGESEYGTLYVRDDRSVLIDFPTQDCEFGWGFDTHRDCETKICYAFIDGVDVELLDRVIREHTGAEKVFWRMQLEKRVKTGEVQTSKNWRGETENYEVHEDSTWVETLDLQKAKQIQENRKLSWKESFEVDLFDSGYIDHQSAGTAHEFCRTPEECKEFLFNYNHILTIDNDNH
jgi:hypothetical protein